MAACARIFTQSCLRREINRSLGQQHARAVHFRQFALYPPNSWTAAVGAGPAGAAPPSARCLYPTTNSGTGSIGTGAARPSARWLSTGSWRLAPSRILEDLDSDGADSTKPPRSGGKFINQLERAVTLPGVKETVVQLAEGLLYADQSSSSSSGLVVINKPYGLPVMPAEDSSVSLVGCLPGLATQLGIGPLEVIKSCDRYCSGITLLSTKPAETRAKLKVAKHRGECARQLLTSYLGVVTGHAQLAAASDTFVLRLAECRHVEKPIISKVHKEPVIHRHVPSSVWKLRKNQEKVCHMVGEVVARSSLVPLSLLNLHPSTNKNHLICVWLADRGHPLLGDGLYDYRVKTVMGRTIVTGPQFTQANRSQVLPPATRNLFGLAQGEEWRLAKFLHQWRLHLPGWLPGGQDLTVVAPPPPHFVQSLEFMKIRFDFESLAKENPVQVHEVRGQKKKKKNKPKTTSNEAGQPSQEDSIETTSGRVINRGGPY